MCRQVRDRLELLSRLDTLAFRSESARTRIVAERRSIPISVCDCVTSLHEGLDFEEVFAIAVRPHVSLVVVLREHDARGVR